MFKNKEGKVRAGFNIVAILAIFIVATLIVGIAIRGGATIILMATGDLEIVGTKTILSDRGTAINSILEVILLIVQNMILIWVVWISWTKVMKKNIKFLGLKKFAEHKKEFLVGLLLGLVTISIVFALIMITGNAIISDWTPHFSWDMLLYLVMYILIGFSEEIFGRGYVMGTLRHTGNNKYVVFGISMLVFALLHGMNNGITVLSYINIGLVAGVFAYMYYKSGNIWMCIGYHITWNFFQGLYGFPVSGGGGAKLFDMVYETNNIFNGGEFGPEGGLFVSAISILMIVFVNLYYRNTPNDFMAEK